MQLDQEEVGILLHEDSREIIPECVEPMVPESSSLVSNKKKEKKMRLSELDEVPMVLSIIKNDRKCQNIQRWYIITVVLFVLVFGLLAAAMALTNVKGQVIDEYSANLNALNSLMSRILMSSYDVRIININSFLDRSPDLPMSTLKADVAEISSTSDKLS